MENQELQHHGIKGMRWGIRRTPAQLGYKTSNRETQDKRKFEEAKQNGFKNVKAKFIKKHMSQMSTQELRLAIDRINAERTISSLATKERRSGFDAVSAFMKDVGTVITMVDTVSKAATTIDKVSKSKPISERVLGILKSIGRDD